MSEAIPNYDLHKTTPPMNPALDEAWDTCEHVSREVSRALTRGEDNPGKCVVWTSAGAAPLCESDPVNWAGDTTPRLRVHIDLELDLDTDDESAVRKELAVALEHLAKELRA